jgi:hypothetical protein
MPERKEKTRGVYSLSTLDIRRGYTDFRQQSTSREKRILYRPSGCAKIQGNPISPSLRRAVAFLLSLRSLPFPFWLAISA